jgi:Methyltransferase domain
MLNWAIRYIPLAAAAAVDDTSPVCDVGSGDQGLIRYLPGSDVIGVDVAFTWARNTGMLPVQASASALPFPDRAFPIVTCCDTLEHVPPNARPDCVRELARICSRRLVVAFPSGRRAEAVDRYKRRILLRLGHEIPPWLDEHVAHPYPTVNDVSTAVPERWSLRSIERNENIGVNLAVFLGEELVPRVTRNLERLARFRWLRSAVNLPPAYRSLVVFECLDDA